MKKTIIMLTATTLLTACGTIKMVPSVDLSKPITENKARITIERDNSMLYFGTTANVKVNGKEIAKLGRGGTVIYDISAGNNTIQVFAPLSLSKYTVDLDAESQEIYNYTVSPLKRAMFWGGYVGDAISSQVSDQSGYFKIELQKDE